jgi:hypothetical protein
LTVPPGTAIIGTEMRDTKSTTINYFGEECKLNVGMRYADYKDKKRHTFVSVSSPWNPEDKQIDGFTAMPKLSRKGDDPVNDKLWRKYNKAEIKMMQEVINMAAHAGLIPSDLPNQLKYSRTYFCSCGCSPGFVYKDYGRKTYWVSIVSPSKELEKANRTKDILSQAEERTLASMVI